MSAAAIAGRQFLPGVRGAWVEQRQREILELRLQALDLLARAACEIGDLPTAIRAGEEAIAAEPFRETAYLNVMDAHSRAGNRGEAFASTSGAGVHSVSTSESAPHPRRKRRTSPCWVTNRPTPACRPASSRSC